MLKSNSSSDEKFELFRQPSATGSDRLDCVLNLDRGGSSSTDDDDDDVEIESFSEQDRCRCSNGNALFADEACRLMKEFSGGHRLEFCK